MKYNLIILDRDQYKFFESIFILYSSVAVDFSVNIRDKIINTSSVK